MKIKHSSNHFFLHIFIFRNPLQNKSTLLLLLLMISSVMSRFLQKFVAVITRFLLKIKTIIIEKQKLKKYHQHLSTTNYFLEIKFDNFFRSVRVKWTFFLPFNLTKTFCQNPETQFLTFRKKITPSTRRQCCLHKTNRIHFTSLFVLVKKTKQYFFREINQILFQRVYFPKNFHFQLSSWVGELLRN